MHMFLSTFLFALLLSTCPDQTQASEISRKEYLDLSKRYSNFIQPSGDASKGEIEIILDNDRMEAIEKATGREVGIIAQDNYWLWVNDACRFPNGNEGVYGRILWVNSLESSAGVVVMPILPDGKIVLNCNFRHATRSWEIELPRGRLESGESQEDAARRETMEETGMIIDCLTLLGEITPDSGVINTVNPIYMATVIEQHNAQHEDSEAIEEILSLTLNEIKLAFLNGYYICNIRGVEKKVAFRDPFLAYAILLYELRKAAVEN